MPAAENDHTSWFLLVIVTRFAYWNTRFLIVGQLVEGRTCPPFAYKVILSFRSLRMVFTFMEVLEESYGTAHRIYYCETHFPSDGTTCYTTLKDDLTSFAKQEGCWVVGGHLVPLPLSAVVPDGELDVWYLIGLPSNYTGGKLMLYKRLPRDTLLYTISKRSATSFIKLAMSNSTEVPDIRLII